MQCRKCGNDTKVIDSQREPDKVKRRRKCLNCNDRFSTVEVSGEDFEEWSRNAEKRMASKITREVLKRVTEHIVDTMVPVKRKTHAEIEQDNFDDGDDDNF